MAKLTSNFTINTDEEIAQMIQELAQDKQRKPCEMLRLLLIPVIVEEWEKLQARKQPTPKGEIKKAVFTVSDETKKKLGL